MENDSKEKQGSFSIDHREISSNTAKVNISTDFAIKCTCFSENANNKDVKPCAASDCVFGYLQSGPASFENFKIQIGNVNKHISVKVLKKFIEAQGFDTSKIKPVGRGFFFATLRSAEERDRAVKKLNGQQFRGRLLEVKASVAKGDPLLIKRSRINEKQNSGDFLANMRRVGSSEELESNDCPIAIIAPLYRMPYDPDQLVSKQKHATECLKRVQAAVKRVFSVKRCGDCLGDGIMSAAARSPHVEMCPITPSPVLNGYRNKAKFTIGTDVNGKSPVIGVRLGRYREGSTAVAAPTAAPIFGARTLAAVTALQACFDDLYQSRPDAPESIPTDEVSVRRARVAQRLSTHDMVAKRGHWVALTVRESRLGDCLLEIELRREDLSEDDLDNLVFVLKKWFQPGGSGSEAGVTAIHLNLVTNNSKSAFDSHEHCVFGKDTITELCCDLRFTISKDAFFQVNTLAAEKLYEEVRKRCQAILALENKLPSEAILLDVCCGTGTIGMCLANCFDKVYGIELVPSAVQNARENAKLNGIKNVEFYEGKAEVVMKDLIRSLPADKEILAVLDPPRAGVNTGVIEAIRRCEQIRHVIFIACDLGRAVSNFEAFARPTSKKYACAPFIPTKATCVDLFPHTPDIEVILSMKRFPSNCNHGKET